ncbi:MAG: carboxyl transferase domain-containing protein [Candidatus Nitrosopolaris sp.]
MDFTELEEKRKQHLLGGGQEKQEELRSRGKLTAYERMNALFDAGTFVEIDPFMTHECSDFGLEKKDFSEMEWLQDMGQFMADLPMPSHMTSRS